MYEEVVIGFDTRIPLAGLPELWDDARRDTFLLRRDALPLSVDEAVWPRTRPELPSEEGEAVQLEILTPRYASVEDALAQAEPGEVVIAISAWRGPGEPELPAGPAWPMKVDPDWQRLGWDIVSGVFPSALTNCGVQEGDPALLDAWIAALNDHHLFEQLPDAFAFRDVSNRRVREHAPFSVLGLYRVR
ncbi:MAG: hypothetical protein R3F59_14460 [Myxococcota bacterium]